MLFDVRVPVNAWTVEIVDEGGNVVSSRPIDFVGEEPRFPLAPQAERDAFDAADATAKLSRANDAAELQTYFDAFLAKRSAVENDRRPIVTFGRYLFASLIGADAWTKIRDAAKGAPIELALTWGKGKEDLAALPWETMHDGQRFLMQYTNVGIVRRVTGGLKIDEATLQLASPPKVLIVVGTEPRNEVIRAGVEYLRMIQALREAELDLGLQTFLLLEASDEKLRIALKHAEPDVVHFICHGGIDPNGTFLELVNAEDKNKPVAKKYAAQIATLLQSGDGRLPTVVVITACESAVVPRKVGQIATPLAADLVKAGVPLVVGMAGRVSDQACRLFTRRFYESLLSKGEVAQATAQGRRAAIAGGRSDPESTVDWALPVLFFSDSLGTTKLPVTIDADANRWSAITARYQPTNFPAFCDRAETTARLDMLNASGATQMTLRKKQFDALLINVPRRDEKYGCTRLLLELASKAIRDGHLACIVTKSKSKSTGAPKSIPQLLARIVDALDDTVIHFDLQCPDCEVAAADIRSSAKDCPTCADLRAVYTLPDSAGAFEKEHGAAVRVAQDEAIRLATDQRRKEANILRRAFARVAAFGRLRRPEKRRDAMRLVFLVDDLHEMAADAVAALLDHYLSDYGLHYGNREVRIVLGSCAVPPQGQESTVGAVTNWLAATGWVEQVDLGPFVGAEELAAYEHFLLNWVDPSTKAPRPLTIATPSREKVLGMFRQRFGGVPSRFTSIEIVQTLLDLQMDLLVDADDEVVLRNLGGQGA